MIENDSDAVVYSNGTWKINSESRLAEIARMGRNLMWVWHKNNLL